MYEYDLIYFTDDKMILVGLEGLKLSEKIKVRIMPDCLYIKPMLKDEHSSLYDVYQGVKDPEFKNSMYEYLKKKNLQGIEFVQIGTGYYERFAYAALNTQKHIDKTMEMLLESECPDFIMII